MSTELNDLGEDEVREFILYLQERQVNGKLLSSHTVANRVRGLKGFFSWLGWQVPKSMCWKSSRCRRLMRSWWRL